MKQSSIKFLAKELYEKMEMKGDGKVFDEILSKAEDMHKREICYAWIDGDTYNNTGKGPHHYYTETFKEEDKQYKIKKS